MNLIYLSPHFPDHYHQFCANLKKLGANVLGIGDKPYDELDQSVKDSLTEYYLISDMHDYDQLVRACGYFTHRYGKIDRFESLNEYWLGTEAHIRDDFNITGIRGKDIDGIKKKSEMKKCFQSADIPVAIGQIVTNFDDAQHVIQQTGYPVVVKPDNGVGAIDTYLLNSEEDLRNFLATKPDVEFIMEEFIQGDIISFDGLADAHGDLVFYTGHHFSQGIMETVNEAQHISYTSLRDIPPALEKAGRKCVEAFKVRERFFHIEFFKTAQDRYVALEVNMRPPGGFTTDMFNFASDIDVYNLWARVMVDGVAPVHFERKYHCCYTSRKNRYTYLNSHEKVMEKYSPEMNNVVNVPGVFSSALGDIGYIFRSPDITKIEEIVQFIHQTT